MYDNFNYSDVTSEDVISCEIHDKLMELEVGEEKIICGHKVKHIENDMYIVDDLKKSLYFYQVDNLIEMSEI